MSQGRRMKNKEGPLLFMWQKLKTCILSTEDDCRTYPMKGATHHKLPSPQLSPSHQPDPSVCSLQTPTGKSSEQTEAEAGLPPDLGKTGSSLRAKPLFALPLIKEKYSH